MTRNRLEAFSDGVIAILITIMVLELSIPHHDRLADLWELRYVFLSYVISFVYLAIYWNNHHHVLYLTERVTGAVLWANIHLLFWLSLVPFATAWMGENDFTSTPTSVYGVVLLMAAIAYYILVRAIIHSQGRESLLARAIGNDLKGRISVVLYAVAIPLALAAPWASLAIYWAVAAIWLVPDRRIERVVLACEDERRAAARQAAD
jgi:TMEM175 potassium channel family protein